MPKTAAIVNEPDLVILPFELATVIIYSLFEEGTEYDEEFNELFTVEEEDFLGDPDDQFYQVITFTRIIRRKSDGKMFGCVFTDSPGNDMEIQWEQSLYELGLNKNPRYENIDEEDVAFLPVKTSTRIVYEVIKPTQS